MAGAGGGTPWEAPCPSPDLCLCLCPSIPGTGQEGGISCKPSLRGVPAGLDPPSIVVGCFCLFTWVHSPWLVGSPPGRPTPGEVCPCRCHQRKNGWQSARQAPPTGANHTPGGGLPQQTLLNGNGGPATSRREPPTQRVAAVEPRLA